MSKGLFMLIYLLVSFAAFGQPVIITYAGGYRVT